MRRVLLDTNTLSDILKGIDSNVVKRATAYADEHGVFVYTAISVHEILYGFYHKDAKRQLAAAKRSFQENEVIVPVLEDYKFAGRIRGIARQQGKQLTLDDCLIGAMAERLGLPIATSNTKHFQEMSDAGVAIELENWRDA